MRLLGKIMIGWGAAIFSLLYLGVAISACAEAYTKSGAAGLVLTIVLCSAIPSFVLGAVVFTHYDTKEMSKRWSRP